jgi:hypothetical protein
VIEKQVRVNDTGGLCTWLLGGRFLRHGTLLNDTGGRFMKTWNLVVYR